ncbi:MAG: hypothetical protein ACRDF7_05805, partial [Candidatus Limnocylindrales bacterium]
GLGRLLEWAAPTVIPLIGAGVGALRDKIQSLVQSPGPQAAERVVIGGMEDLGPGAIGPGERTLLDQLPNLGNTAANWAQNARVLLREMGAGNPIRDASVNPDGTLKFLDEPERFINLERDLLRTRGWTFDSLTTLWSPP